MNKANIAPESAFQNWVETFAAAIEKKDGKQLAQFFAEESYWKDFLSLTWEMKTLAGPGEISSALETTIGPMGIKNFRAAPNRTAARFARRSGRNLLEGYFEFDTAIGVGVGFARLSYDEGDPSSVNIWQLLTTLDHIHGLEEHLDDNRPTGENYSKIISPYNWQQDREGERSYADRDPEVVIIGAGQSGLMLAARLRQMNVDALVIEKTKEIGDVWRDRYNNLTLHNELMANHFPYMPYPTNWPLWLPKDRLAGWLEAYADFQDLNVWTATELVASSYDEEAKEWQIKLRLADGRERAMKTKHVVAAVGISGGAAKRPKLPGLDSFAGSVIHSGEFKSGLAWKDKRAIVIGTGNSGHDIAQDLFVSGAKNVSLMQRGPTCVVSLEPSAAISYSVYGQGHPIEDVDLMVATMPYPVLIDTYKEITRKTNELDKDLLEGLEAAGFKTHSGEDETGFQLLYLRGGGGYYVDVGCSELIINGDIPVLHAEEMDTFQADGLRMKDGTLEPCDLIVLATGFEGMQSIIRKVMGDEVADRVGPVWGFDEDNNLRNMWKKTAQDGFWIMGGALVEARLFSKYLALQIKSSLDGLMPEDDALPLKKAS